VQRSLAGRMDGDTDVVPPPFLTGGDVGCAPPTLRRCCRVEGDGALLLVAAVARSVRAPGAWCWGCATVMTAAPHTSAVTAQTRPTAPTCSGKTREATPTTTAAVPADHAGSSHPAAATRQQPPGGLLSSDRRLAQAHLPRVGGAAGVARDDLPDPLRAGLWRPHRSGVSQLRLEQVGDRLEQVAVVLVRLEFGTAGSCEGCGRRSRSNGWNCARPPRTACAALMRTDG
jgi:hypothetical protein